MLKARFLKTPLFLPFTNEYFDKICSVELKFSGFVVLGTSFYFKHITFHPVHFDEVMHWNVCWIFWFRFDWSPFHVFFNFWKISMLTVKQWAICLLSKKLKSYSFWSVLVRVIFSQVSPGIPQRVADLISWCQVTIQF